MAGSSERFSRRPNVDRCTRNASVSSPAVLDLNFADKAFVGPGSGKVQFINGVLITWVSALPPTKRRTT